MTGKVWSHNAILHPVFSSDSLSTKIVPYDYLLNLEQSMKVDFISEVCPIFNRFSGESHDVTMTFCRVIIILNTFLLTVKSYG